MARSLYLATIFAILAMLGAGSSLAAFLAYVWTDVFQPQLVAWELLSRVPVSMLAAILAVGTYLLTDRRAPPRPYGLLVLMAIMAAWCAFTTVNDPAAPGLAWFKFDWAEKTMLFSIFMPFVLRSRVQIEAFLLVLLFSSAGQFIPFGAKTLVSGGGYGLDFGLVGNNTRLGESGFLSATCALQLPIMWHLYRHGRLIPRFAVLRPVLPGMMVLAVACAYGTFERTALIGIAISLAGMWWRSGRRLPLAAIAGAAMAVFLAYADPAWIARMTTTTNYQADSSANTRLLVWQWTLDFVAEHPLGGGFGAYAINTIPVPLPDGKTLVEHGRAFHSIYFEVLGEHGYPGMVLFLSLMIGTVLTLRHVIWATRESPEHAWLNDLATSLGIGAAAVFASGAFIGIGFQSVVWFIFALSVAMRHHVTMAREAAQPRKLAKVIETDSGLVLPIR